MKKSLYFIFGLIVVIVFLLSVRFYNAYYIDIATNNLVAKKVIIINPFFRKDVYAFMLLNKLKVEKGEKVVSAVGKYAKFEDVKIKDGYCLIAVSFLKGFENSSNMEYLFLKSIFKTMKSFDDSIKVFRIKVVKSDVDLQMDYDCAMTLENDEIKIIKGSCDEK